MSISLAEHICRIFQKVFHRHAIFKGSEESHWAKATYGGAVTIPSITRRLRLVTEAAQ